MWCGFKKAVRVIFCRSTQFWGSARLYLWFSVCNSDFRPITLTFGPEYEYLSIDRSISQWISQSISFSLYVCIYMYIYIYPLDHFAYFLAETKRFGLFAGWNLHFFARFDVQFLGHFYCKIGELFFFLPKCRLQTGLRPYMCVYTIPAKMFTYINFCFGL